MDWQWRTLAEVVVDEPNALTDGPFGSKLKSEHYVDSGVRVVRLGNIGVGEFKNEDRSFVSMEYGSALERHRLSHGDLLIAALAEPVGRCCEVPAYILPAIVKADCIRFRPDVAHNRRFIMHWLNSPEGRKYAERHSHGVGRLRINMNTIRKLPIPVPPRSVQDQVVAAIETHFSRLDAAVASLNRAKANVKRARASVLKAAVEGRLVPTEAALARAEGRDYEPASVLLERILAERKAAWAVSGARGKYQEPVKPELEGLPKLPEGWCWAGCDQVGEILLGRRRAPEYTGQERPYLRVANVKDGSLYLGDILSMPFEDDEFDKYRLKEGDVLVSEGQSPELVGQSALYRGAPTICAFQATLHRFRPVPGRVSPRYAETVFRAWVRSGVFRSRCIITTNIGHLTLGRFKGVEFPLPPLPEQHRIVAEVDRRLSVLDALDRSLDANLARCARLRQSILKRAFEGRLVPPEVPRPAPRAPAPEQMPLFGASPRRDP